jgi:hypothetical protein
MAYVSSKRATSSERSATGGIESMAIRESIAARSATGLVESTLATRRTRRSSGRRFASAARMLRRGSRPDAAFASPSVASSGACTSGGVARTSSRVTSR